MSHLKNESTEDIKSHIFIHIYLQNISFCSVPFSSFCFLPSSSHFLSLLPLTFFSFPTSCYFHLRSPFFHHSSLAYCTFLHRYIVMTKHALSLSILLFHRMAVWLLGRSDGWLANKLDRWTVRRELSDVFTFDIREERESSL